MKKLIQEVHRRSLWQVLGIYVVGSWIALQVVDVLVDNFGLPDWFPAFALGLLVIGLPVVIATAFVQEGVGHKPRTAGEGDKEGGAPGRATEAGGKPEETGHRSLLTWRNAVAGGVLAFALWGALAAGWLLFGGSDGPASSATARDGDEATVDRRSIAVLPLANRSVGEEGEFFAAGVHDDILTQLSKIGSLKVISRASVMRYEGTQKSMREIGDELGVATVVEGSVERAGDRVRINVQLIDAATDEHLWAEAYDRELTAENIFGIRTDVARQVAAALEATLAPEVSAQLERAPTNNLEAYDLYVRGRYLFNRGISREDLVGAASLFRQAIEADPDFALAYTGLADTYLAMWIGSYLPETEALVEARRAAERALELDESLAEAHASRAFLLAASLEWKEAEREFKRALELNPGYATAHRRYANLLLLTGRIEEALVTARRAVDLDPLSRGNRGTYVATLLFSRDYEGAIDEASRTLEIEPEAPYALYVRGTAMAILGRFEEGIGNLRRAVEASPENGNTLAGLAWVLASAGEREEALEVLARAEEKGAQLKEIGVVHGELGNTERAFEYLRRALAEEPGTMGLLEADPTADALRSDPRFDELVRQTRAGST